MPPDSYTIMHGIVYSVTKIFVNNLMRDLKHKKNQHAGAAAQGAAIPKLPIVYQPEVDDIDKRLRV